MWRGIGYWSKGPESTYGMLRWSRWLHTSSKNHTIHIIIVSSRLIWSHVYSNMYMTCIRAHFTRFLCPSFPCSTNWGSQLHVKSRPVGPTTNCWIPGSPLAVGPGTRYAMYARRQFVRCCKKAIGFRICIFPRKHPCLIHLGCEFCCKWKILCVQCILLGASNSLHAQRIWTLRKNPRVAVSVFSLF